MPGLILQMIHSTSLSNPICLEPHSALALRRCHVMERESFTSLPIAKLLNDSFVAIKVDKEERSDVDRVYMTYVQVLR